MSRPPANEEYFWQLVEDGEWIALPAPPPDSPDHRTNEAEAAPLQEKDVRNGARTKTGQTPSLALETDILSLFVADLRLAGVAGEERLAKLTYLALTSRVLGWKPTNRPVSVMAKGTTSTGKSYTTQTVLRFFPSSAYLDLGSMSKRYLLYTEETLSHRFIVVPEASSIAGDDEILAALRTLLSEGRLVHGTVDGEGKRAARKIEKEGPTGLLITTTAAAVDAELETRCLSLITDDSTAQTRRVFETLAELEDEAESPVHFASWHDLQTWIAEDGETRVSVPFIRELAREMPNTATRLRRDFVSLLCLIRAHAVLHQANREQDSHGRILASLDDYAAVRELITDLVGEGVDAQVSPQLRETVEAYRELQDGDATKHVSISKLAGKLGVGRTATYDRVNRALLNGYLVNEAKKDDRAKRIVIGSPLPGEDGFLPTVDDLVRVSSGGPPDTETDAAMRDSEVMSSSPVSPAGVQGEAPRTQIPLWGEPAFPDFIDNAFHDGHITEGEWIEERKRHARFATENGKAA